jgi:hypothetical protein
LADQRPIVRSAPVIPLETAEFDSDGFADGRQRVKPTRSRRLRMAAGVASLIDPDRPVTKVCFRAVKCLWIFSALSIGCRPILK